MENDRGIDDLFGELDDERPEERQEPVAPMPAARDPHELHAAFIEAATAPQEPLPPADAPQPYSPVPSFDPGVASSPAPAAVSETPAAPVEAPSAFAPPLTRRELRERQRSLEDDADATIATGAGGYYSHGEGTATFGDEADEETVAVLGEGPRSADESARAEPERPAEAFPTPVPTPIPTPVAAPAGDSHVAYPPTEPYVPAFAPERPAATPPAATEEEAPIADSALAALATAPAAAAATTSTAPAGETGRPLLSGAPRQQAGRGFPIRLEPPVDGGSGGGGGGRRRSMRWLAWFLPLVIVLGGIGFGGWYVWTHYEDQIREVLGWEEPNDYEGAGNGEEAIVTILPGDIGEDVAITLHDSGVTRSFDAFYDLLLELGAKGEEPSFQPGNYRLQHEMSAQSALDALLDPANKILNQLVIPEGSTFVDAFTIMSNQTGIPIADFWAANANLAQFGLPAEAVSLEGYLFPAQYDLDGTETAVTLIQRLVNETFSRLDALGVAPENRNSFLTMASIVQRESGPNPEDPPKIARVFQNRLDQGMLLESDATTTYGSCVWGPLNGREAPSSCGSVFITQAEIEDTSNPYNTRANPGLPIGPVGAPSSFALDAVAHPADGPWLFFVTVNLATGETAFSETIEEHNAAVDRLYEWCDSSDEAAAYCA